LREFAIQGEGELHKSPLIIKMGEETEMWNLAHGYLTNKIAMNSLREAERRIIKPMETKSRYEVVLELEEKKRNLVMERDCLGDEVRYREKQIRDLKREIEDKEDDLKDYKENLEEKKNTIKELIEATEDSLNRLAGLNKSK